MSRLFPKTSYSNSKPSSPEARPPVPSHKKGRLLRVSSGRSVVQISLNKGSGGHFASTYIFQFGWRLAIVVWTINAEPGTIVALNDSAVAIRWDETGI